MSAGAISIDEISVEQLAEDIEMLVWEQGASFKITESFPKRGECTYLVRGLQMEICDDGCVVCRDYDDILPQNMYALLAFLKDCVLKIKRYISEEERYGEIYMRDGNMIIRVIE